MDLRNDTIGIDFWFRGTLRLLLRYRAGAPLQSGGEMTIFGGPDPAFFRVGAILLVFAKNTENGEFAFRVVRSFSANAHAIPAFLRARRTCHEPCDHQT
jgi:hypothetical protein